MRLSYSPRLGRIACSIGLSLTPLVTLEVWASPARAGESLAEFETDLPVSSTRQLSRHEQRLLVRYLDAPSRAERALALGDLHFERFEQRRAEPTHRGLALESAILTQYFYHRAESLGSCGSRARQGLEQTNAFLDGLVHRDGVPSNDEQRESHLLFRRAFHFEERLRHDAAEALAGEFANDPANVYTAFALTAVHLWIGGESAYGDPSVVYDFALGSYFSLQAIELAHRLETAWSLDPSAATRFRMASILGGFSALQRRWLAALHGDAPALRAIDDEHRQWRLIHRSFHSFTVGIPFFEVPELFDEGFFAVTDATVHCAEVPVRTCSNEPRFYYNLLGFSLTLIDFFLKQGDIATARSILTYRFAPAEAGKWDLWQLGQEPWLHREQHAEEISALYRNDDPSDDPLNALLHRKQWGTNTTTCQVCHQSQGKTWTEAEFNTFALPPEPVATIGNWPAFATTWYASLPEVPVETGSPPSPR